MVQATTEAASHGETVSETPGFRRSVLQSAIAGSQDPALLASLVGLFQLVGQERRQEATGRMKVLGAVADAPRLGRDVAAELGIDASTASRHLAALEADGLVTRTADQGDRRARPIVATAAGREAYAEALRIRLAGFDDAVADWSAADREQLATLLERLVASLSLQTAATPSPATERIDA